MIKLTVRILLLGLLVLALGSYLNSFFKEISLYSFSKEVYNDLDNNINIAFFGSSHSYAAYNPAILEAELKANTYNFGGSARRFVTSFAVMNEVIKENDLKLAIVDIFSMSLGKLENENSKGLQFQSFDNTDMSWDKIISFCSIFGYDNVFNIFPLVRNHHNWFKGIDVDEKFILNNKSEFYNGYYSSRRFIETQEWTAFSEKINKRNEKLSKDTIFDLNERQKKLIDRVIRKFEKHKVALLFVSSPSYYYDFDIAYTDTQMAIRKYLLTEKNADFIDFNLLVDSLKINKNDFKDPNHLNVMGGIKHTEFLADYIKKNYVINTPKYRINEYNRYESIASGFENSLSSIKINEKDRKLTGISRLHLLKNNKDRFELLFQFVSKSKPNKNIHIKMGAMVNGKMEWNYALLKRADHIEYRGVKYAVYQFNQKTENLKNSKLYVGPKRNILIADYSQVNLNL